MKTCPVCGQGGLLTGATICKHCGAALKITPTEQNDMNYTKVGLRAVAAIVDTMIFFGIGYGIAIFTGGRIEGGFRLTSQQFWFVFGVFFLYYVVMEATTGTTIGKHLLDLRVVQVESGLPISWQASLIRNILRVVDGFLFYLVGAILVRNSDKGQRLGDRIAKTAVIRNREMNNDNQIEKPHKDIKLLALCMIVGGAVITLAMVGMISQILNIPLSLGVFIIVFIAIWHILKGIDLWKGKKSGYKWAKILFATQIPIISVPGLMYNLFTGISIGLVFGNATISFTQGIGGGFHFSLSPEINQHYFGINLFAVIALVYLFIRQRKA